MSLPIVAEENANQGSSAWRIVNAGDREIEGYASATSVLRGESIALHVRTTAPAFRVEIYRMGWYQGLGGRFMTAIDNVPGIVQPSSDRGRAAYGLLRVAAVLRARHSIRLVSGCLSRKATGRWVIRARLPATSGFERYIVSVVRDDARRPMLFQTSVTTYQAYNAWGGRSLYGEVTGNYDERSRAVSFDRPFAHPDGFGSGQFLTWEFPLVRWLEREGFDLPYATNIDVHSNRDLVSSYALFLGVGHDEYWSYDMRDHVESALQSGTSLAFLGANAMYWQVRLEPSSVGPYRHMVCYKGDNDPDLSRNADLWRNLGRPEQEFIGVMYDGWFRNDQVPNVFPLLPVNTQLWPYANSGLVNGQEVPGLVGYEYDMTFCNFPTPPSLIRLAESCVTVDSGRYPMSHATLYTAPSGAMVFGAGTNNWALGLIDDPDRPAVGNPGIQTVTRNILNGFMTMPHGGRVLVAEFGAGPPAIVRTGPGRRPGAGRGLRGGPARCALFTWSNGASSPSWTAGTTRRTCKGWEILWASVAGKRGLSTVRKPSTHLVCSANRSMKCLGSGWHEIAAEATDSGASCRTIFSVPKPSKRRGMCQAGSSRSGKPAARRSSCSF